MIRSELDVLLDKVQDPALRADLRSQIDRLKQRRSFGLVFEHPVGSGLRLAGAPPGTRQLLPPLTTTPPPR